MKTSLLSSGDLTAAWHLERQFVIKYLELRIRVEFYIERSRYSSRRNSWLACNYVQYSTLVAKVLLHLTTLLGGNFGSLGSDVGVIEVIFMSPSKSSITGSSWRSRSDGVRSFTMWDSSTLRWVRCSAKEPVACFSRPECDVDFGIPVTSSILK